MQRTRASALPSVNKSNTFAITSNEKWTITSQKYLLKFKRHPGLILLVWLWVLLPLTLGPTLIDLSEGPEPPVDLNQTSAGVASSRATPDGRPLIWKNRDRGGGEAMEFRYWDQGPIPFIGYTSDNERLECYGGVNALGFAVANTDAHNFATHGPHNDGATMWYALSKCRTVDDFEAFLDSADRVDVSGRYGYTYQVIDAYGGAAIVEAAQFGHTRYNAADAADGFIVRSNYAHSGPLNSLDDTWHGIHRHNRAFIKFKQAVETDGLTPEFILREVARDLSSIGINPYPLPFQGYYENNPYGAVPNFAAICRSTTSATLVIQGVPNGGRPEECITWAMLGPPLGGIATPLWVRAGSVPPEYDDQFESMRYNPPAGSRLNRSIIAWRNWAYNNVGSVDTWKLTNPARTGLWDYVIPLENWVFAKTERFLRSPDFNNDRLRAFQNETAQQIADSMANWRPFYNVTEFAEPVFSNARIILRWRPPQDARPLEARLPRGYYVYRSDEPFREFIERAYIGWTPDTTFIDANPLSNAAFYQVEAIY